MDTNINISTINRYFSRKKEKQISNVRTKIVNNSYFSINEANISHKISKIPYYSNFFSILDDHEELNLSQLNENIIEKLKLNEDIKYYLFKYSDKNSIDFIDFLYNFTSIKKLIFNMLTVFPHLLQGLQLLYDNNVCFFDISPQNIKFLENYREKPVFNNFKFSLRINNLDFTYFSHILNKLENFTYQPLEIHLLFYFAKHNMKSFVRILQKT